MRRFIFQLSCGRVWRRSVRKRAARSGCQTNRSCQKRRRQSHRLWFPRKRHDGSIRPRRSRRKPGWRSTFGATQPTKSWTGRSAELRAGKPLYDVALTNTPPMEFMFKEGALAKYDSPSAKFFPKEVIHPQSRTAVPQQHHRHRLSHRHHQAGRCAEVARKICSSRSIAAKLSFPTPASTRPRRSGWRACTKSWAAKRRRTNSFTTSRRQSRCWCRR